MIALRWKNKITLSALAISAMLFIATAQAESSTPNTKPANKHPDHFEMLANKLNLSEKQKADMKPLIEKHRKEKKEALSKLREQHVKELSSILNEQQIEQFMQMKQRRHLGKGNHSSRNLNKN